MKIAMMSYTNFGGAGRAAVRLMNGLNEYEDVRCNLYVRQGKRNNPYIIVNEDVHPFFDYIQTKYFMKNIFNGNVLMSLMYSGIDTKYINNLINHDIIHFHWIANYISLETIDYFNSWGKGLVWTLHDGNPFTGGCHYMYCCEKYQKDCDHCKQMKDNPYNITKKLLNIKKKYMPKDMIVVAPSNWMADSARKSAVFRKHRIEVIPNSIELDIFKNYAKVAAKNELGIKASVKTIFFGAENHNQIHKGFKELLEAMHYAKEFTSLKTLIDNKQLQIILVGNPSSDIRDLGIPYKSLGCINDDIYLAKIYSAADITVLSSIEDNLPNIMLESLACGTPVIAFRTGGIPDLITTGFNGIIVDKGDTKALGIAIAKSLQDEKMQGNCRSFAKTYLSQKIQAKKYKDLYADVLNKKKIRKNIDYKVFPETIQALAPYLYETIEYVATLRGKDFDKFLDVNKYEDNVIDYVVNHAINFENYSDNSIAIWGAGEFSRKLLNKIVMKNKENTLKIKGIFDKNNKQQLISYELLDIKDINKYDLKVIFIGSLVYENEIFKEIEWLREKNIAIIKLSDLYVRR